MENHREVDSLIRMLKCSMELNNNFSVEIIRPNSQPVYELGSSHPYHIVGRGVDVHIHFPDGTSVIPVSSNQLNLFEEV